MASPKLLRTTGSQVIIIGAGISGLASAQRLLSNGCRNVLLLEAADRLGGRICTKKFGNGLIELGAQWIHGEVDNVVYEYANKHGLQDASDSVIEFENIIFCTEDGLVIDNSLSSKMTVTHHQAIETCRAESSSEILKLPVDTYLDRAFEDNLNDCRSDEELRNAKAVIQWFKRFQCSIEGCDSLADMSVESLQYFKECEGKWLVNLKNGYSSVVNLIANGLPHDVIQLNKCVAKILSLEQDGSKEPKGSKAVKVICEDGTEYLADHVILTVSIGVLKAVASTMFEPKLPPAKLSAIEKMGFGTVNKIFLEFQRPFWPQNCSGYSLIWSNIESVPSKSWYHGVFGFYTLPFVPNVLCGWISGVEARQMELLCDDEVKKKCVELLERFTGKKDLPPVVSFCRSSWNSNPFVRGSYSYFTAKSSSNAALSEPIYSKNGDNQCPRIMFAGEATHPHFFSTVNGAMESGWREADRLLKYLTGQPSSKL